MKNSINILVVEDDENINELLCRILVKNGYNARAAFSGSEAIMCVKQFDYQLVMLDLMLPGVCGEDIIKKIREHKTVPIIVISAKSAQENKVDVLKLGADDFISKPFDINEVMARVEAQLRRFITFSNGKPAETILNFKGLSLNLETRRAYVKGEEIVLTAREFSILELMMSYPGKVFTKANLYEHVWNDSFFGDDNTLMVHISNIRSKIAHIDPENDYINTVWGIGYKMAQ